jgi:hypothetical protein
MKHKTKKQQKQTNKQTNKAEGRYRGICGRRWREDGESRFRIILNEGTFREPPGVNPQKSPRVDGSQ